MTTTLQETSNPLDTHALKSIGAITLDHVTLRTRDIEGTKAFLEAVMDLTTGYRPNFPFPGYWLYAGEEPLVHLIPAETGPGDHTREAIDHVGFRLADHDFYRAKLDRMGVAYSRMELKELGERRLFLRTPSGVLIELVFRDRTASDDCSNAATARLRPTTERNDHP